MADIEMLKKGLRCIIGIDESNTCNGCKYYVENDECEVAVAKDSLALLKEQANAYDYLQKQFFEVQDKLIEQPQIVRCKDCKHYESGYGCKLWHTIYNQSDDWFCADGERRTE